MKKIIFALVIFLFGNSIWAVTADEYYKAGNSQYTLGNYSSAIQYYQAAAQADPQYWRAYQALGTCEYQRGQKDQALKDFNQSLAIHPDNPGLKSFVDQITPHAAPQPPTPSNNTQPFQPSPVSFAPEGNALPKQGRFIFNAGFAADIGGYGDFQDYYGGNLNLNGAVPVAVELDLGLDYTIIPQFQMGINFNGIYRHTEPVSITSNIYPTFGEDDTWTEFCIGPAVDVKGLIPLSDKFSLILQAQAGYYTLVGSSLNITATNGYQNEDETADLSSSTTGEMFGIELEWMRWNGIVMDIGLGYRMLKFTKIDYTLSGTNSGNNVTGSGTLYNAASYPNYTNAAIDFSGLNISSSFRFF